MKTIPICCLLLFCGLNHTLAQLPFDSIAQPAKIIGKIYNDEGQCVDERTFQFTYNKEGQLTRVQRDFSSFTVSYENGFVHKVHANHFVEHGALYETKTYTYQNGLLTQHEYTDSDNTTIYRYTYDDSGNLIKMDLRDKYSQNVVSHYFYEYADQGKTKIESYYYGLEIDDEDIGMKLKRRTTWRYNNRLFLTERMTDIFDTQGNLKNSTRVVKNYFDNDLVESETSQILKDGQWVNTEVVHYVLDEKGRVAERETGSWSETQNKWSYTHKTVYEYNEAGNCQKVSFFQQKDGQWTQGRFEDSPLWFDATFDLAQEATQKLCVEEYDTLDFSELEISYTNTKRPFYHTTETYIPLKCEVFPNPGSDIVTVSASLENGIIRFYDTQGRMVYEAPFDFRANINTGDWTAGIYVWEIWRDSLRKAYGKWVKK